MRGGRVLDFPISGVGVIVLTAGGQSFLLK